YAALNEKQLRKAVVHELIDRQVTDILNYCREQLQQRSFANTAEAKASDFLIQPSAEMREQKAQLERFLYDRVYRHPKLIAVRSEAQDRLTAMFHHFVEQPETMPSKYRRRAETVGLGKAAVEFIAGMTDHYCEQTARRIFTAG
ncbi:MAG: metal-dependent phosphohydrolase, partial [Burkholderiales bacterium]|nr:metal-dependent phosphohydrolase [Burkholderiales bacterium]